MRTTTVQEPQETTVNVGDAFREGGDDERSHPRHARRHRRITGAIVLVTVVLATRNISSQRRQLSRAVRVASIRTRSAVTRLNGDKNRSFLQDEGDDVILAKTKLKVPTGSWSGWDSENPSSNSWRAPQAPNGTATKTTGVVWNSSEETRAMSARLNHSLSETSVQMEKKRPVASSWRSSPNNLVPGDNHLVEELNETFGSFVGEQSIDCGCPQVCDAVGLSRRVQNGLNPLSSNCETRVRFHMIDFSVNETDACVAAAHEGSCGPECDPKKCHNLGAKEVQPPPLNWTRVIGLEQPFKPFHRYDGVVVATKVHSSMDMQRLKQMLCLFTAAYNRHVNYDVVVFSTLPWRRWQLEELQSVAPQTKITVIRDSAPLKDQLAAMLPDEEEFLRRRCSVGDGEDLTWSHYCTEPDYYHASPLGYAWQAEFRSYKIWKTAALAPYRYMLWIDADSYCTGAWSRDPIQVMFENNLVLLLDNFPAGYARNPRLNEKLLEVYNRTLCSLTLDAEGFTVKECNGPDQVPAVGLVHGMMHVTSLDFFRSETNLRYLELHVKDHRFSREWDDQLAVTFPAALQAPERVRDMRMSGFHLGIHHNGYLDGKDWNEKYGVMFWEYWTNEGRDRWEVGREMCDALVLFND